MANARLKQARRRASARAAAAAQNVEQPAAHTPPPSAAPSDASGARNEPPSDAQSEREALQLALLERRRALEAKLAALTLGRPLTKEPERERARCQRDFLLQEMEWMAADFAQERKWRLRNAKALSQALVSHLDRQEARAVRQQKSAELARRRAAARVGRDVKKFWSKIDKIIAFKVKLQADELRQRHMQKHLTQLVAQTEKYAGALAATFQEAQGQQQEEQQLQEEEESDADFEMQQEEQDDETTIEEEEQTRGPVSRRQAREEVATLQEEAEMSIEELRARYAAVEEAGGGADAEDSSEDEEFELVEEEEDDETTIAAEERRSGPVSRKHAAEVAALQEQGELSIEELRARYAHALEADEAEEDVAMADEDVVMMDDEEVGDEAGDGEFVPTRREEEDQADDETTIEEEERLNGDVSPSRSAEELRLLQEDGEMSIEQLQARYAAMSDDEESVDDDDESSGSEDGRDAIEANREQDRPESEDTKAEAVDPSASTTADTSPARKTGYKRPYILTSRLDLREYQEAGVNWLISMCERRINGILADEMGLGKTIQTISLLAHLACAQGLWGPHLIVVPTSCLVNWEMEFKRWCPAFKVLTYFGSAKRRKELRQGWSKQNAFQVCITSYQLVVQDAHCFKRKKWYYLILDEAHNIKNWKSLRWQTLLTFSSQRRLLLTGTPLQNNLLELWALMHFLMPHVFASRKEFSYWFQNPLALMVENGSDPTQQGDNGVEGGKDLVTQLHGIIRPFVLRRLKKDVAKQLPGKFEHVISCQLSKRQRSLYEDFISRSSTRRAMFGRGKGRGANFMSMMNVLMQLRKVCNHPDLFEPRPIASPLDMPSIPVYVPSRCGYLVDEIINERPRVALWAGNNLPGLEFLHSERYSSKRRRELFFYDVSAPLPSDTVAMVPTAYEEKKDLVRRIVSLAAKRRKYWEDKRASVAKIQSIHVGLYLDEPVFGAALIRACTMPTFISPAMEIHMHRARPFLDTREPTQALQTMVRDPEERLASLQMVVNKSVCYVPKARAQPARIIYGGGGFVYDDDFVLSRKTQAEELEVSHARPVATRILAPYHNSFKRTQLFFPDKALVQFDCGKLQQLAVLLRTLKRGGHRCLIFTQMSSMLNILEVFLNLHGHTYFRLDGATKVDKRQMLMERFNRDEKIFCFILSTRSGGLGINLTGADAVIFYDSDWNPAMDAQAQDRAHRIGQTRDVHIYRLVSEHTVEENILRKAQQKRHLDFLVMSEGQFTTDFFSKASLRELMIGSTGEEPKIIESESEDESTDEDMDDDNEVTLDTVENAMAQLEDEDDVVAMKGARAEYLQEQNEFDEDGGSGATVASPGSKARLSHSGDVVSSRPSTPSSVSPSTAASDKGDDEDDEFGVNETAEDDTAEEIDAPVRSRNRRDSGTPDASEHDESMDDDDDHGDDDTVRARSNRKRHSSKDKRKPTKRRRMSESQDHHGEKVREKARDAAEEQKLQAWKASVSSLQGFEDSLNPVDRYALHFRDDIDPLYAYTPAQQAEALAGVDSNPSAPTLLENIEQTEAEKREEEARLIAEGELVVGQMDGDEETSVEQMTEHYTELYRRERAHVLFERRKRLLTGAAWSLMRCINTGQPFYFNADTREATWECPPVWVANEQLKSARERGYEGLPPPALQRVMAMLTPFPERHRAQMVCRSWHTAAQHQSLFVKICASDFEPGSPESLAKVLAKMAPGDTVLFGAGVYPIEETLEISKSLRLLATPDSHVELQMRSCRAQLRWSARGGVICGFHFTRTSSALDSSALEITPSSDANEKAPAVKESRRSLRKKDKKLANWQHLLSVVGDGQLRVEYCEFDGNGLGNACVCVWGRSEKKKKKKKKKRREISNPSTPQVATPVTSTPTVATPRATTLTPTPAVASTIVTTPDATPKVAAAGVAATATVTPRVTIPVTTTSRVTSSVAATAVPSVSTPSTTTARVTMPAAAAAPVTTALKAILPPTTASVVTPIAVPASGTTTPRIITPVASTLATASHRVTTPGAVGAPVTTVPRVSTPGASPVTTTPRVTAAQITVTTSTSTIPAADTLLVLQNCRIRGAGSSGVLLMRGSLVMLMNTVEGNAHSGVTVLGGQALLRRNKIQRNARFGLRLLYHAGNVIVEDNVVFGNACGNLDVDNSGRRFVVRLNDMDKGKKSSNKLPHSHGKLRLKTYRVLEKEIPHPQPSAPKPVTTSAASEYWKRQLLGASGAAPTSLSAGVPGTATSTTASARPVLTANTIMAAGIPMGFMRSVVFLQGTNPMRVSHLPLAFASVGAKPTIPTVTLNRSTTSTQPSTTTASLQRTVSAPGVATSVAARQGALPVPTSAATTTTATSTAASILEPPKKRRKRRPKTEQVIVGGREILLRDTCEKPTEKVVKPRRPKEQQPQTPSVATSLLQQMTSASALQLKFAPGSTAAAVAAAMSAMMANTAKIQAASTSTPQVQAMDSVVSAVKTAIPKPATPTTLSAEGGVSSVATSTTAAKPAVTTTTPSSTKATVLPVTVAVAKSAVTASSTPVAGLSTMASQAVPAKPAAPVQASTVAKTLEAKPLATPSTEPPKEPAKPGDKPTLEPADTEAKPTTHEKKTAGAVNGLAAEK
ncbi:Protein PHOTOPERIOD-INDEPENDENT EARLY FLOWERING 1 [Phytophthora fragariae]|uniref:Protein PHOTOPERIOD-INDEPENDENT EARLY FLOWERING 1 n=1 Tax=Phytophthora fragariae TaxID=53985 RepID=A0A6A3E540_9STRA|nr:Protein PHOTOPERIOD-INDEPENDENT EARLY FLOWERING 1 [Phytophthora fragariae]KAE8928902.1 Protein PHOTOPERIOD-INDEPENDENT EARLY FLOWERING 1 [Phytophthora fragariae]KAE9089815.1 Protein PHOTOPERIOD-INDEPENDENT EARLY FLOWERING 1 [Phytophthora fragariae]KAE9119957.1 Protein PHOTOPERIOD-INDEPENDENT EARLY FLOWERING 1 [Phytophthora fragariae]KAE9292691.1 Protein PHOTOPERIOD-INDEPENDENT EARLY FLOWERING 1 [Phytophthora fragariae]